MTLSASTILRCGGGCGSELVTTDPVNHRAVYMCPRCSGADRKRFFSALPQSEGRES